MKKTKPVKVTFTEDDYLRIKSSADQADRPPAVQVRRLALRALREQERPAKAS